MSRNNEGFTLIELMIVVAIIGILSSIAVGSYQTYTIRAQVSEGISLATNAKAPVTDAFLMNGEAPADRTASGMTAQPTDTQGSYVSAVDVVNGRVDITFGNRANQAIAGRILTLTPYETPEGAVVWRCGKANVPQAAGVDLNPMGTSGGGNATVWADTTVDEKYLPTSCRP